MVEASSGRAGAEGEEVSDLAEKWDIRVHADGSELTLSLRLGGRRHRVSVAAAGELGQALSEAAAAVEASER